MSDLVTQCPKCQTAFRVTESQLQAAHGAVRCGSCLHIFVADEHRRVEAASEDTSAEANSEAPSYQTSSNESAQNDLLFSDDDLFLDDDTQPSTITDEMLEEIDQLIGDPIDEPTSDGFSFFDTPEDTAKHSSEASLLNDELDGDQEPVDEGWAQALLQDEEPQEQSKQEEDYSVVIEDLDSDETVEPEQEPAIPEQATEASEETSTEHEEDELDFIIDSETIVAGERINETLYAPLEENKESLLANIQPEPVIFKDKTDHASWKRILWTVLFVIGLAGLFGQYLNANFDQLAKDPNWREHIKLACSYLGCELPPQRDINKLQATNLVIRSHPEQDNALIMDAIITNHAIFQQPYPQLELRFTNIKGKTIAAGVFQPEQYLAGELLGSRSMPKRQPIHVTLSIADPGPEAVNYQLLLSEAQQ